MTLDIEGVLAGHQPEDITAHYCACSDTRLDEPWTAHVAAVLREQIAAAQAEAWDEGHGVGYKEHGDDVLAGHGIIVGPATPNPLPRRPGCPVPRAGVEVRRRDCPECGGYMFRSVAGIWRHWPEPPAYEAPVECPSRVPGEGS